MARSLALVALLCLPTLAQPIQQTIPAGFASGSSPAQSQSAWPFTTNSSQIWQWHYDSAQFNHPGPITITECYVRVFFNYQANAFDFPSLELTMASSPTDYSVLGSGGVPGHDPTFANNLGSDATVVRPAAPWVDPAPPAAAWLPLGMTTPFTYDPTLGQDFVLQVAKCGTNAHWGAGNNIFGITGSPGTVGGNRYGHTSSCGVSLQNNQNDEYVPVLLIDYIPAGAAAEYQVNSPGASFDINQVFGTASTPATVTVSVGQSAQATFISTNQGQPWELLLGTAPLLSLSGGAVLSADGQIINVDLADPTLIYRWNIFQSPPFTTTIMPFSLPVPASLSAQMLIVDPAMLTGLSISQPSTLVVQ